MTDEQTAPLFPDLVAVPDEPLPNWCRYPLFILAYWPRGRYWSIKAPLAFDAANSVGAIETIKRLQAKGWQHVTILRLPAGAHPWNAP